MTLVEQPAVTDQAVPDAEPLAPSRERFLQAILRGDRQSAADVAREALRAVAEPSEVYVEVFQRALYAVGRLWEANLITVADEHLATAVAQTVIAEIYGALVLPTPTRGRIVLAGVEGERHQVGSIIVADVLEADGWSVHFLGTDMNHDRILQAVEDERADVLGISCTLPSNVPRALDLVHAARARLVGHPPRILLGGGAFVATPAHAVGSGADGVATDVRAAVALLRTWSTAP
jgi:methanogenic corrinoid protein MtbC1